MLVERIVDDRCLWNAIDDRMAVKKAGAELDRSPGLSLISEFPDHEFHRLASRRGMPSAGNPAGALDEIPRFAII